MSSVEGFLIERRNRIFLASPTNHYRSNIDLVAGNIEPVLEWMGTLRGEIILKQLIPINLTEEEIARVEYVRLGLIERVLEKTRIMGRVLSEIE